MNIFLLAFTACNDIQTNNELVGLSAGNLDHVFVDSIDQSCRAVDYWPYGSPQEHGINAAVLPVVLFLGRTGTENGEGVYTEVFRLESTNVTTANILAKLQELAPLDNPDSPGQGGVIPTPNESGNGVGWGLGLGFGLPAWVWWVAAAGTGYKAIQTRNRTGQVVFGTLTGLSLNNALKASSTGIEIGRLPLPSEIGKVVDNPRTKPGSRAEEYWGGLTNPAEINAVIKQFSLHSIEWGNWVGTGKREEKFWMINTALINLAKVMNVSQKRIGFGGRLSISYGSRGRGRALATYHPHIHHINLTKDSGDGSLAHEYGHAIDYHAQRTLGFPPSGGLSRSFRIDPDRSGGAIPQLFESFFEVLYYKEDGSFTSFAEKIKKMPDYWKQRNEVWARTFEAWVLWQMKEKGLSRDKMLVDSGYNTAAYPSRHLLKKADPYIRRIITKVIGR